LAVPVFACAQAMHVPVQALSQQKPSTQLPFRHSFAPLHVLPLAFLPIQAPPEQVLPVRQCASLAHEVRHAVAEAQTKPPAHDVVVPGTQAPAVHEPCGT
jgi:hypothetical protein